MLESMYFMTPSYSVVSMDLNLNRDGFIFQIKDGRTFRRLDFESDESMVNPKVWKIVQPAENCKTTKAAKEVLEQLMSEGFQVSQDLELTYQRTYGSLSDDGKTEKARVYSQGFGSEDYQRINTLIKIITEKEKEKDEEQARAAWSASYTGQAASLAGSLYNNLSSCVVS